MNMAWHAPQNIRSGQEIITTQRPRSSESSGYYAPSRKDYIDTFYSAYRQWISETRFTSNPRDLTSNAGFQTMVKLAKPMFQYIIDDLRSRPSSVVHVLDEAFGIRPYPDSDAGSIPLMTNAWISWAERNGSRI